MKCPTCTSVELVMSERSGIEIDYCPTCRGVWLDRGELDKLIDRAASQPSAPAPMPPPLQQQQQQYPPQQRHGHGSPDDSHYGYTGHQGKRKKSWFSEIFD